MRPRRPELSQRDEFSSLRTRDLWRGSLRRRPNRPGFSSVLRRYRLSRFL